MTSLASQVTTPFRLVAPGQGNFNEEPRLGLESFLLGCGMDNSAFLISSLDSWFQGNYFGLLDLLMALRVPGIAQVSAALMLLYKQEAEEVYKKLAAAMGPRARLDQALVILSQLTMDSLSTLTDYLGYKPLLVRDSLDPQYLLQWAMEQEPVLQEELSYLLKYDLLMFVKTLLKRQTKTDIQTYLASSTLSAWLARCFAPAAFSDKENQDTYFAYVSFIQANS